MFLFSYIVYTRSSETAVGSLPHFELLVPPWPKNITQKHFTWNTGTLSLNVENEWDWNILWMVRPRMPLRSKQVIEWADSNWSLDEGIPWDSDITITPEGKALSI